MNQHNDGDKGLDDALKHGFDIYLINEEPNHQELLIKHGGYLYSSPLHFGFAIAEGFTSEGICTPFSDLGESDVERIAKMNIRHTPSAIIRPLWLMITEATVYRMPVKIPQTAAAAVRLPNPAPPQPRVTAAPQISGADIVSHQISRKPGGLPTFWM